VARHYKNKLNKPVWLMGHSNGADEEAANAIDAFILN
jgi:hypothetical protein